MRIFDGVLKIKTIFTKAIEKTYAIRPFLGLGGLTTLAKIGYNCLIMGLLAKILFF
ncbi:hypothetical protein L8106_23590 [Lyngbya sp. PCC 8106]|nr:hypothetical protein L8106_23590 [Lyngbya sp. PCC 8106]